MSDHLPISALITIKKELTGQSVSVHRMRKAGNEAHLSAQPLTPEQLAKRFAQVA
jgi:hypothetical protein